MKRYAIYGGDRGYDVEEDKDGFYIFYYEFVDFISARIKELEDEMDNEDSIYSEASCRFRIDELKRLLK